ncbi:phosphopantothenoylcysteine decarboxylase [Raphidocelis subcapitata]|uniref:phosphopantothenoylcysteine decarboxylase n=1 Tax=Raphidocelis subcapitata TaxID=307507 RepID=A0A2V0NZJ8_9CHLO|nr:phosphopantothenoylcysteine decarboxylase [Raphidocelis subcapitata]|eukprot:GBF90347.1 phosphopantothenoylcysteine decarboxylase [Raphidocelis subcapitata]
MQVETRDPLEAPEKQQSSQDGAAAAPQQEEQQPRPRRPRVLLGLSGSVATIKAPLLCRCLCEFADVRVIATAAARRFVGEGQLPPQAGQLLGDEDEWRQWKQVGDPVMHIELRRWADALVIAPLSANTLAKAAGGLCDNLLTCVVRAWDFDRPLLVAPAMNTLMWDSPFTRRHLDALAQLGVAVVPPVGKRLACGDVGLGAMAAPEAVAAAVAGALRRRYGGGAPDGAGMELPAGPPEALGGA